MLTCKQIALDKIEESIKKYTVTRDIKSLYQEISSICADGLNFSFNEQEGKYAHYLSMEFLIGRMIDNNLLNLGLYEEVQNLLEKYGIEKNCFESISDYAFGNGGLGRLAACFLDSGATTRINLNGYGMRYKYGLFKQVIKKGCQFEKKDDWSVFGDPWSIKREEESEIIEFTDMRVRAVPFDMAVIGYLAEKTNILRLWDCEALEGDKDSHLCDFLYPDDSDEAGKILRLRQEYFFSSSSMRSIIKRFVKNNGNHFEKFSEQNVIQLNDTHPIIAILDFIYLLTTNYKVPFQKAVFYARQCFNYTNHTIMSEALEQWDVKIVKKILNNHYKIALKLQKILLKELTDKKIKEVDSFKFISNKRIHMANLALFMCKYVNGVAEIHTKIIKEQLFKNWNELYPHKIQNKTNGITPRRWLKLCNSELSSLLESRIGSGYLLQLNLLKNLENQIDDDFIQNFIEVKKSKKRQLQKYLKEQKGLEISSDFIFDMQIKRIHEYKRQLLNAFSILYIYNEIKSGRLIDFNPTLFLFAGKAATSYKRAKTVIRFINDIANLVNHDKEVNHLLQVVFVQDYNVSVAEKLFPACDISEQISLAGTEASGTGNMKFMLNGTVTLGTYDGANVEIVKEAGLENNYIFGLRVEDIAELKGSYNPIEMLRKNEKLKKVVNTLIDGTFEDADKGYKELYDSLTIGASWHKADNYYLLYDLESYVETKLKANKDYGNRKDFALKCIRNLANAGKFSSDRTIQEYAKEIWKL